jgi:hypothetical protein
MGSGKKKKGKGNKLNCNQSRNPLFAKIVINADKKSLFLIPETEH